DARRRGDRHWLLLPVTFACVIGFGLFLGWAPLAKRLGQLQGISTAPSTTERLGQFSATWHMIEDHPWWGAGPFGYRTIYQFYAAPGMPVYSYTHNDWLQTLAEWGWVGGLAIFLAALIACASPLAQPTGFFALSAGILVGAGVTLTHSLVDFPLQIHSILFTLVLLLAVLASLPARKRLG
ncbi:MAG TPA: O-antigen ligase family protein, partial [Verrucomicrobiae bacterium]|nr:O-antigen ligase family protein [Verrucomicrobiae bacterium]